MREIRENPNYQANIAILCPYIFFAQAYTTLIQRMPRAEIVPDFTASPPGTIFTEESRQEFREWLTESGLPWRDLEIGGDSPANFFSRYGTVVAPWYGGWLRHPVLKAHKKVRVFYGAAKDLWGFSPWNVCFDLVCTPGPYFTDTLNDLYGQHGMRAVSTGEPKLDDFYTLSREAAREALEITGEQPVVLVQPTWGKASSLGAIAGALVSLSSRYTIIVKAHHRSSKQDPDSFRIFENTGVRVIDQKIPVPTALAAADMVISDGSGAIFDALRADKPLVIMDTVGVPDDEFHIETYYGHREEKLAGTATYAASTEQRIKRDGERIAPVESVLGQKMTPGRLAAAIEEALNRPSRYASARAALMASHFTPIDGKASERIAIEVDRMTHVTSPAPSRISHLFVSLVHDFYERAKQEEAHELARTADENAVEAGKMRQIKQLPYAARLRTVIHEFFN